MLKYLYSCEKYAGASRPSCVQFNQTFPGEVKFVGIHQAAESSSTMKRFDNVFSHFFWNLTFG